MTDPTNRNVSAGPDNAGRMQGGQFAPGCSGNPAGMKIGTRHRTARLAQRMMSGDAEDVVKAVVVARPVKALASAGSKWYNTFYTVSGFY